MSVAVEFEVDSPHGCIVVGAGGARHACVVTFDDGEQLFDFYDRVPSNGRAVASAPNGRAAFRVEDIRRAIDEGEIAEPVDIKAVAPEMVLTVSDATLSGEDFRAKIGALFDDGIAVDYGEALYAREMWRGRLGLGDGGGIVSAVSGRLVNHWERESGATPESFLESRGLGDDFREFMATTLIGADSWWKL